MVGSTIGWSDGCAVHVVREYVQDCGGIV